MAKQPIPSPSKQRALKVSIKGNIHTRGLSQKVASLSKPSPPPPPPKKSASS